MRQLSGSRHNSPHGQRGKGREGTAGEIKKVSEPKQKNLNEKNSKRYLVQLGNGNFGAGDLHVTYTYNTKYLPKTEAEAERRIGNYLSRIAYRRKKLGLPPLKYILVTEYGYAKDDPDHTGRPVRIHHHVIMNAGLDRDEVEMMWTAERINWRKYDADHSYGDTVERLGYVNADRIQINENGIEALCKYVMKNPKGKKRWSSSRNLVQPVERPPADGKYSKKKVEALAKSNDRGLDFFQKRFPDYTIAEIRPEYYEETGWHIYLKMWKKPEKKYKRRKGSESVKKEVMFSSATGLWATPQDLFDSLDAEFHFDLDPCADDENHKCEKYFTEAEDGLAQDWGGYRVFCNPPYGRDLKRWVEKAYREGCKDNTLVVLLIPACTDTTFFHDFIMHRSEIRFISGRLRFNGHTENAPFPSMIAVFRGPKMQQEEKKKKGR